MKSWSAFFLAAWAALPAAAAPSFNGGVDLRIRHELMENVPGLPGGGLLSKSARGGFREHMRFRPRLWSEMRLETESIGEWRLFTRLTDEFRWNPQPKNEANTWPDELIVDNLFLEGKGLFNGFLDVNVGRQDLYGLYGLDHVFVDGTPGDGSRTTFGDMIRATLNFTEVSRLDLFFLHDSDDNVLRCGTDRSKHRALSGICSGADPEMDDWGWGAIFSSQFDHWLKWQVFAMQKVTESFHDKVGVKHPWTRREMFGLKLEPRLTDELSLQLEAMAQIGRNGDGDWLSGWSAYAGGNWKSAREGWKPYARLGFHIMSGDEEAEKEDGGHQAWDPMWARGVNDSEIFLYGTHYGVAWWSNQIFLKATAGLEFSRAHSLAASTGPLFAAVKDGLGGGDGAFKGLLSQAKYAFPIWLAGDGGRFEVVGHLIAELFNPGDYFETSKPAWFFRWQIEFKF